MVVFFYWIKTKMPDYDQFPIPQENAVPVYRVENPNIAAHPDGVTSHEELVGQWFSPNLSTATDYLRKSTQTFGPDAHVVDGAQLVVAYVPADKLDEHHVSRNSIAAGMDVENDNYIIPRDSSYRMTTVPLDETIGDLRGKLGNFVKLTEAKRRVAARVGQLALPATIVQK